MAMAVLGVITLYTTGMIYASLPTRVQSLLGPGGPALRVSGSENIRISGTSNWTNQQVGPLGQGARPRVALLRIV